jgi:hypothetical protein
MLFVVQGIAHAAPVEIIGNQTTVSLTASDFLTFAGFEITPLDDAVLNSFATPPEISFPITGGRVDTDTGFARIEHDNSGFSLTRTGDGRTVFFRNFLIDTENLLLSGDTTFNQITSPDFPLFDVAPFGDQFSLHLTTEAALLLGATYLLGDLTGEQLGLATVDVQVVPIPAAFPMLLSGLAFIGVVARRRKQA